MSGLVIAAIISAVFFAAGVVLGVTVIISFSVTGRRRPDRGWPQHGDPAHRPRPPGYGPPESADDEIGCDEDDCDEDDTRPQWPDSGYRP